jgi:hypothetical protein
MPPWDLWLKKLSKWWGFPGDGELISLGFDQLNPDIISTYN